jgi:nucleoside-diphosphate-sugar epimerase
VNHRSPFQWGAERVLVTGASGFIGSFLVETLVRHSAAVHCLLRPSSSTQHLRAVLDRVEIHRADLTGPKAVKAAVSAARPDTVFHLAATGATNVHVSPAWATRVNVEGTLNLLQALDGSYRVFVNTGTCHEYGGNQPPFREDQDPRPELPYAITKTAAWRFCRRFHQSKGWPIVTVRPFSVYGPRQAASTFVSACIRAASSGLPFDMTPGQQTRDWIYVQDVVEGLLRAAEEPAAVGGTFNLCTGRATSLYEVAQIVVKAVAARRAEPPIAINRGALAYRSAEIWQLVGSPARAREVLGWTADTSIEQGIRQTVRVPTSA